MEKDCKGRINDYHASRWEDIDTLYNAPDQTHEELGSLDEYGLSIDLVEAGTFKGQREDYKRYQLGWGGPSDEYRLYKNGDLEYWFLDWYDGAHIDIEGKEKQTIVDIIEMSLPDWN
jgi:hypothetical protein